MFIRNWFKIPKPPSEIDLIIQQIKKKDPSQYSNAYSSDQSINKLLVCKRTIKGYNSLLSLIVKKLTTDEQLSRFELPMETVGVYLRDFLTDDQGNFIDVNTEVAAFFALTEEVLSLFQQLEQQEDKSFNTEKNLYLIQNIIHNLRVIVTEYL